jgi:hypothetical protein
MQSIITSLKPRDQNGAVAILNQALLFLWDKDVIVIKTRTGFEEGGIEIHEKESARLKKESFSEVRFKSTVTLN